MFLLLLAGGITKAADVPAVSLGFSWQTTLLNNMCYVTAIKLRVVIIFATVKQVVTPEVRNFRQPRYYFRNCVNVFESEAALSIKPKWMEHPRRTSNFTALFEYTKLVLF